MKENKAKIFFMSHSYKIVQKIIKKGKKDFENSQIIIE